MGARPGGAGEAPDILDQLYFTSECHFDGLLFSSEEKELKIILADLIFSSILRSVSKSAL